MQSIEENKPIIDNLGNQRWYKDGKLHRDNDQPAVIRVDGTKYWCQNGEIYREDDEKPAMIKKNKEHCWVEKHVYGLITVYHQEKWKEVWTGLPSKTLINVVYIPDWYKTFKGIKFEEWIKISLSNKLYNLENNISKKYRNVSPITKNSILLTEKEEDVYLNGQLDKAVGKTIIRRTVDENWFNEKLNENIRHIVSEKLNMDGPIIQNHCINEEWFKNDKLHKIDGPAKKLEKGTEKWFFEGKLHRVDGPAVTTFTGTKKWYLNGKKHRLEGPALTYLDGRKFWYLSNKLVKKC